MTFDIFDQPSLPAFFKLLPHRVQLSVVDPKLFFLDPDPTFQIISHPAYFREPKFVYKICHLFIVLKHSVRLNISVNFSLKYINNRKRKWVFYIKTIKFLYISLFCRSVRIRIRNDLYRIRIRIWLKVSDPTGSGSTTSYLYYKLTKEG